MSAIAWYDSIIDDILSHPGTTLKDTSSRLGRAPGTIGAVVGSDLFKARWVQRREQFTSALDARLTHKLAIVAEKGLDAQIEILEKKRDSIPLPVLNETVKNSLDRLGYGPTPPPVAPVVVHNNVVSAEALASARENLRTIEGHAARASDSPANQSERPALPDPAGGPAEGEEEDGGS
jgi:hypothetical protein